MIPYESKLDAIVIVPNALRDAINAKLDAAFIVTPDAQQDREYLYATLLAFFHEHGYLPDFELQKRSDYPHASDCAIWVGEKCDCVTGRLA